MSSVVFINNVLISTLYVLLQFLFFKIDLDFVPLSLGIFVLQLDLSDFSQNYISSVLNTYEIFQLSL